MTVSAAPVAKRIVVDFDGTVIRGDLGRDFIQWLKRSRHIPPWFYVATFPLGVANQISRLLLEVPLCNRVLLWLAESELADHIQDFLMLPVESHEINESLLRYLYTFNGERILLTGSPELLVSAYLAAKNITCFDAVIGQRPGRAGWLLNPTPFGRLKPRFIRADIDIVIANERADRHLLRRAKQSGIVIRDLSEATNWVDKKWKVTSFGQSVSDLV